MTPPLDATDLYHTGIVVPDLEVWKARMTEVAGHRWTETLSARLPVRLADGERVLELRYAYSLDAPHIELVQEIPGTPWTATEHIATHHLGYFCDDVTTTSKRLEEAGFALEACAIADGEPSIFAYHLAPSGVRIEIVDRARIPDLDAYLRSKAPTWH
ncbi:VOC family protein [Streptomyces cylindrosporus]|uniref:VOC family protein n=1 Tax=Streptomyces cylindrosporus TaxID=2927583 RepID=A0ABS9YKY4_9ACTN|nr:VOC family protein [Streptomyces cylindrosporus]MCI3277933.1 VOC family protein [Streptomyces cylindrosporus]